MVSVPLGTEKDSIPGKKQLPLASVESNCMTLLGAANKGAL